MGRIRTDRALPDDQNHRPGHAHRPLLVFVVAFILFNDGVQTTIAMASIYATETLELGITIVIVAVLLVQFVAFSGRWLSGGTRCGSEPGERC